MQTDEIIDLVFQAIRSLKNQAEKVNPCLSHLQYGTLRFISENRPTMRQVADYLRVKAPSATVLVEELAKPGYVARVPDPKDRRIIRLKLSPSGEKVLEKNTSAKTKLISNILQRLSVAEKKQLMSLLAKINKHA